MTRENYIKSLKEKSDKLYEFISSQKNLVKFYENIIKRIEKGIDTAEEEIMQINDELDVIDNWLGGNNE